MFTEVTSHLHPILVHFPIALILVATVLDIIHVIRKRPLAPKCRVVLWIFAAIGVAAADYTGPEHDAFGVTNIIHLHSRDADITMWLTFLVLAIRLFLWWRKKEAIRGVLLVAYLLLTVVTSGMVLATGYYGGMMVYDQGVGVSVNGKAVNPPKAGHFPHHP